MNRQALTTLKDGTRSAPPLLQSPPVAAKVSTWGLLGFAFLMALGAVVCAWVALAQHGYELLLLPFAGYLLQKSIRIFAFFVVGPTSQTIKGLIDGPSSHFGDIAAKWKRRGT